MRRAAAVAIVVCLTMHAARAQSTLPASAPPARTLRGVVVDARSQAPLPRTRIEVMDGFRRMASVLSGGEGEFTALIAGDAPLLIRATKAGYAAAAIPLSLDRGSAAPLRIEMAPGAAVTGRVLMENGEAVTAVPVRIRAADPGAGAPAERVSLTFDERGAFRVGGLPAGRYSIAPIVGEFLDGGVPIDQVLIDLQAGIEMSVGDLIVSGMPQPAGRLDPPPGVAIQSGVIGGRVSGEDGEPLPNATVTAQVSGRTWTTTSDATGRFRFTGLPAGSFDVAASKRGFLRLQHGQRGSDLPGLPIRLQDREEIDGIELVLPRAGIITGVVVDEFGDPFQDATVHVLRVRRSAHGQRAFRDQSIPAQRTDDRGEFRLWGIAPGTYILIAALSPEDVVDATGVREAYVPAYYPGTPEFSGAWPLQIAAGDHLPGVKLTLRRVPVFRVSGTAMTSAGLPLTGTVRLAPQRFGSILAEPKVASPDLAGEFSFTDVPPGDYVVHAFTTARGSRIEFATGSTTVLDRDPDPLALRTAPGATVTGRFVLEGEPATLWGYSASAMPVDVFASNSVTASVAGPVSSGTTFTLSGLAGPTRLLFSSPDANWYLKAVRINGFDVVDVPFDFGHEGHTYTDAEVVFSRGGASIAGAVADDRLADVQDYAVIVFSGNRDHWLPGGRWLRLERSAADGRFRVDGLPPGDYWIAAVDRINGSQTAGDWQDPDVLSALTREARRVTLGPGELHSTTLRLTRVP